MDAPEHTPSTWPSSLFIAPYVHRWVCVLRGGRQRAGRVSVVQVQGVRVSYAYAHSVIIQCHLLLLGVLVPRIQRNAQNSSWGDDSADGPDRSTCDIRVIALSSLRSPCVYPIVIELFANLLLPLLLPLSVTYYIHHVDVKTNARVRFIGFAARMK